MFEILLLGILAATPLVLVALAYALFSRQIKTAVRVAFIAWGAGAACVAYWTTFRCVYFSNDNTRVHGWPVPIVVFQRADSDSPWLDYVGPTTLMGYPMNFALFMAAPSLLLLALAWRQHRRVLAA